MHGSAQHEPKETPAAGDTSSHKVSKLLRFNGLSWPLGIRRVLVRAQEGQWPAQMRRPFLALLSDNASISLTYCTN